MSATVINYPKIASAAALPGHQLEVRFRNGDVRRYDFRQHLSLPMFRLLQDEAFFKAVQVDTTGYGLVWNDDMDIAASELWLNGQPIAALAANT
jgi:hypothetical protein